MAVKAVWSAPLPIYFERLKHLFVLQKMADHVRSPMTATNWKAGEKAWRI